MPVNDRLLNPKIEPFKRAKPEWSLVKHSLDESGIRFPSRDQSLFRAEGDTRSHQLTSQASSRLQGMTST